MIFEFQAWMHDEVSKSTKHLLKMINFKSREVTRKASKDSHIASLNYQLHQILRDVNLEAMKYHSKEKTDSRKGPYCGKACNFKEYSKGYTICGKVPSANFEYDQKYGEMTNFVFSWNEKTQMLEIRKRSIKKMPDKEKRKDDIGKSTEQKTCG